MKIIPINNGYYNYKSIDNQMFRALCKKTDFENTKVACDVITLDDVSYIIGAGKPNFNMDKTTLEHTKVLTLNMLARFVENKKESFQILLSSPPIVFNEQSEKLPQYLKGTYKITWNKKPLEITIDEVYVLPETFIVYNVNNDNKKYSDKIVLIIDVGGFTTNICKVTLGNFKDESDYHTIQHGMYHLDTEISQYLNSKHSELNCHESEMFIYRKTGLTSSITNTNILEIEEENINDICNAFIDDIIDACIKKGWNVHAHEILVTGGGGATLYPLIKKKLPKAELSHNPIFDNLNGLELYTKGV
jgi:plasmid segregation protein ParM